MGMEFYSARQLMKMLDISQASAYRLLYSLDSVLVMGSRRISRDVLEAYLAGTRGRRLKKRASGPSQGDTSPEA